MRIIKKYGKSLLIKELKKSYNFFIREANWCKNSNGYGLIRDKTELANEIASIASVGYGLAAYIIGVEHGWISYKKAYDRVNDTLDTFLYHVEGKNGFFYHFVNMNTGKREWNCELSIIDTGIFICGAMACGEYFGGKIKQKAEILYSKVNWRWYVNEKTNQFYMGYTPEKGFWGKWDMYAEQLMLYILGVASNDFSIAKSMYDSFEKISGDYGPYKNIIYTYCGTLFTYQFSHAWIDFRNRKDKNEIDWFENSVKATKANRQYCMDQSSKFHTYGENSWGLTACLGPKGYSGGYGARPAKANLDVENDGTVSPCASIGSIVFTPKETTEMIESLYNGDKKLWGKYGFRDGYNFENGKWYAKEYIGIDKGISMVMIENYLSGTIWECFMKNAFVKKGLQILNIQEKVKEYI